MRITPKQLLSVVLQRQEAMGPGLVHCDEVGIPDGVKLACSFRSVMSMSP